VGKGACLRNQVREELFRANINLRCRCASAATARYLRVAITPSKKPRPAASPQGAGIGWHKDRPEFRYIIGISLLTP
jgi:hypothetical protein